MDLDAALASLRENGYTLLHLPHDPLIELKKFCDDASFHRPGRQEHFTQQDVTDGRLPSGEVVPVAYANEVNDLPAVRQVASDPVLTYLVGRYLGYEARLGTVQIYWSPASSLTGDQRRQGLQTIDFHYDVDALNFAYVHFYLTDVDGPDAGAHVIVRGSHRSKPLRLLFSSARASQDTVLRCYGEDSTVTLTGPAGSGFIEDTSAFHRACPPVARDRLMLQLRFN